MFKVGDVVWNNTENCYCFVVDKKQDRRGNRYLLIEERGSLPWWAFEEQLTLQPDQKWNSPTLAEVEDIVTNMPGGLDGFLKGWGWLQFAREVEKLCKEKNA